VNIEGEMKAKFLAAAALVLVSVPAFSADIPVRDRYAQRYYDNPLIIDYTHNYGPADFYPGTLALPDRVVVPLNERPYGIYDGFGRHCEQSSAHYRGQDGRVYPCE
jgi:hypothetical protein